MSLTAPSPTALHILTTAELLFAQHGYAGVSLRQITRAAQVNLAAVNYHFYDKESLYRELLTQRLHQLNARRLTLLVAAESQAHPALPPLRAILDPLARPLLMPDTALGPAAARLLGRILTEPFPSKTALLDKEFHPPMIRFGQAIRRQVPGLTPKDFLWRFSFVVGALHHAAVTSPDMGLLTQGICHPEESTVALENFTALATKALL